MGASKSLTRSRRHRSRLFDATVARRSGRSRSSGVDEAIRLGRRDVDGRDGDDEPERALPRLAVRAEQRFETLAAPGRERRAVEQEERHVRSQPRRDGVQIAPPRRARSTGRRAAGAPRPRPTSRPLARHRRAPASPDAPQPRASMPACSASARAACTTRLRPSVGSDGSEHVSRSVSAASARSSSAHPICENAVSRSW